MKTELLEEDRSKGTKVSADCCICKRETLHFVLKSITQIGEEALSDDFSVDWRNEYQIIRCGGCEAITFRETNYFSEDHLGDEAPTRVYLYPIRNLYDKEARESISIPNSVGSIYSETIKAYNNSSFILCAAGLRATVEAICNDLGIKGVRVFNPKKNEDELRTNLDHKIKGLVEHGHLTQGAAEILHTHRFMGNEALHEIKRGNKDDLLIAIEIIEHLIVHIYDLPEKAKLLKRKRN